jgi:hypothetical protein
VRHERADIFERPPVARWKTPYKRFVLWMYEHDLLSAKAVVWLLDVAKARLA